MAATTRQSPLFMAILRRLNREQNLTIVMVTHDRRIAEAADRTVALVDGRVMAA